LQLTNNVLEGNFAQEEDALPSGKEDLMTIIQFGVKNLLNSDESTISDEEIETILSNAQKVQELQQNVQTISQTLDKEAPSSMYGM
jgi:hypothetical protein